MWAIPYSLNGKILFEQDDKNGYFWVRYDDILSVLRNKYGLKYQHINDLMEVWGVEHP